MTGARREPTPVSLAGDIAWLFLWDGGEKLRSKAAEYTMQARAARLHCERPCSEGGIRVRVCVFCASSRNLDAVYVATGRELGEWIGKHGHTLVWGGCNVGLMDVLGRAVVEGGGKNLAVIPEFLVEKGLAFPDVDERIVTIDLAERKAAMRRNADVFVALPGGIGTWEEVLEVLALKKLGQLDRPVLLANVAGYFDPLLQQIERSVRDGFSPSELTQLYDVVSTSEGIHSELARWASGLLA